MQAKELIKWNEVSVVLTGNPNTIRGDRTSKKHVAKIEALLDYVQNWIDRKGNVKEVRLTVKVPIVVEEVLEYEIVNAVVELPKKLDYVAVQSLPQDRKIVIDPECRGIYSSGNKFYTNKVKDGAIDIRQWSKIEKAKEYLKSLK